MNLISVENLSKAYGEKIIFDNLTFGIDDTDKIGVIGVNGTGKSTLLKIIAGEEEADSGNVITMNGLRVGYLPQSPVFKKGEVVMDYMIRICKITNADEESKAKTVLTKIGINDFYADVDTLSGGQKKRVAIGAAMISPVDLLILDEPINGLDPMGIVEIRELLKKINKEKDMTILISSHILSELSELATTYGIISNGKLIEEITAKQLSEKCRQYIDLKVDDTARAVILLERELGISDYEVLEDSNIKVFSNLDNVGEVNSLLSRSGIIVESISVKGENLEEYFMNKVGGVLNA